MANEDFKCFRWRRPFRSFEGSRRSKGKTEYSSENENGYKSWPWTATTILLAQNRIFTRFIVILILMRSIFSYVLWTNVFRNASYNAKLHKNAQKYYFITLYRLRIFASDQNKGREKRKKFLLFSYIATFEQPSSQKTTFDFFWSNLLSNCLRNFGQLFGKSRTTCGKSCKR